MPTLTIPEPSSGPSHRLAFNDPATWIGIGSALYALFSLLWTGLGRKGPAPQIQDVQLGGAFLYNTVLVGSKHFLTGKLAQTVLQDGAAALKAAESVPAVKAEIDTVVSQAKDVVAQTVETATTEAHAAADAQATVAMDTLGNLERAIQDATALIGALHAPKGN